MTLVIVHHHFRPGGVRRIIELATPFLVLHAPGKRRVDGVVLATGEAPDSAWLENFRRRLGRIPLRCEVLPALGYANELSSQGRQLRDRVTADLHRLLETVGPQPLIWAHNLGLGRNWSLTRELTRICRRRHIPLVLHHHDWWFENRWQHVARCNKPQARSLPRQARAIFVHAANIAHAAINQVDARILARHLPRRSRWLPNLVDRTVDPLPSRVHAARRWLLGQTGDEGPVWLLPGRLLRRKNIAEALLLTRWLRPGAWLVTTAGVSSPDEQPYASALADAARQQDWRLRLSVLSGPEQGLPSVPELMAASEVVLLTSLQEGFGLPYLEAAVARRPLIAPLLPNVAPDLRTLGFKFPQAYRELQVDPRLFDWAAEAERQWQRFEQWQRQLPPAARRLICMPSILSTRTCPAPIPFSRLTLTAQLEVLRQPIDLSWKRCAPLNPFLESWRHAAGRQRLQVVPWPREAARWLDGPAYARGFWRLAARTLGPADQFESTPRRQPMDAQLAFLRVKLRRENLYPILWTPEP